MKNALKTTAGMAALALALGGCMSTPDPSPRLLAAEATLQQAKANPATFESGRAPLEKAEIALRQARDFYMKGKDDDYIHSIRMGESYVALAEARGDQLEANRKIASLNKDRADVVSQARTRQVNTAEAATAVAQAPRPTQKPAPPSQNSRRRGRRRHRDGRSRSSSPPKRARLRSWRNSRATNSRRRIWARRSSFAISSSGRLHRCWAAARKAVLLHSLLSLQSNPAPESRSRVTRIRRALTPPTWTSRPGGPSPSAHT